MGVAGGVAVKQRIVWRHNAAACGLCPFCHRLPMQFLEVVEVGAAMDVEHYRFAVIFSLHVKHLHVAYPVLAHFAWELYTVGNLQSQTTKNYFVPLAIALDRLRLGNKIKKLVTDN